MLAVRGWTWEGASGELEKERDYFFYPAHPVLSGRRWKSEPWGIRMALSWEGGVSREVATGGVGAEDPGWPVGEGWELETWISGVASCLCDQKTVTGLENRGASSPSGWVLAESMVEGE